ncbi:MAG: FHA domain-containing protein [Woeseia sp.]
MDLVSALRHHTLMAKDHKKINELDPEANEDTSELEVFSSTIHLDEDDCEAEADAATHSFETTGKDSTTKPASAAQVRADLRARDETIASLQYDLEQLRARWAGLEKELKAREALTENISRDLKQSRRQLAETAEQLTERETRIGSLEERLREQAARLQTAEKAIEKSHNEAAVLRQDIADLKQHKNSAAKTIDELHIQLAEEKAKRRTAEEAEQARSGMLQRLEDRQDESRSLIASLQQYIAGRKDSWARQEEKLKSNRAALRKQRNEIRKLGREARRSAAGLRKEHAAAERIRQERDSLQAEVRRLQTEVRDLQSVSSGNTHDRWNRQELQQQELHGLRKESAGLSARLEAEQAERAAITAQKAELEKAAGQSRVEPEQLKSAVAKIEQLEATCARLSGLAASRDDAARQLRKQIEKTDRYADGLRTKLQRQLADSEALAARQQHTESSLAEALEQVEELGSRLKSQQQRNVELQQQQEQADKSREEEIRRIRFELEAAGETVAENQRLNEQLASDLLETRTSRQTLENRLAETDESRQKDTVELRKKLSLLERQIKDYEQKVSNKDAAINALLTELANKSGATGERATEEIVQLMSDKKAVPEEKNPQEKDRVTRFLSGSIGGKELRFPLFKDRLTIGRTVHNDIQLKAQYVSRRHAVVVTDEDRTRIVDWGSKNGIYVNGSRVSEQVLKNGDLVAVGTAEFKFEERPKR